ncbi:MAG: zinc transporter ZupT [Candidatus Muiribacteriota bacterium]
MDIFTTSDILRAFMLTLFAGLSTGIGGAFAAFAKKTNFKFLCFSLGFSAGVMIYISFVEIFTKALEMLVETHGSKGELLTVISFFAGMALIALIDKLVPTVENPHELHSIEELNPEELKNKSKLHRLGILSALAISIHNFPEGMVTFFAALADPALGITIAIAVAIHNIPEGIAVAVPIYYSTGSRKKAFYYSFLSGLAEPAGALIGFFLLRNFLNNTIFGIIFGSIAGIMVFIAFDQLLPSAEKFGKHHTTIYGLISGMLVMAVSLILL